MAKIERDKHGEEYFAEFIRIDGKRGTVLIFPGEDAEADDKLAQELAGVVDKDV